VKAVLQRVSAARVRVRDETVGEIGEGLCVFVGIARGDDEGAAARLAAKIARLRIFADEEGRFDRTLTDVGGAALVVSQFTLLADATKGNRPSFSGAAQPEDAERLYDRFCAELRALDVLVEMGVFGAKMQVELINDGPVTLILEL
jgi:D-aminoacyl-tRNA deacylase